jgi:predicted alpha/beta-fold hydrolase
MGSVYQKFFVKRYIEDTVCRHKQMQFWEDVGLVDMKKVKSSQNLMEFHTHLTAKIIGYPSAKEIFDEYTITDSELKSLNIQTLMMLSKDDPIVSYKSMPFESLSSNEKITLYSTEKGGHLCWFEGLKPKRWYPKPVLQYLKTLRSQHIT